MRASAKSSGHVVDLVGRSEAVSFDDALAVQAGAHWVEAAPADALDAAPAPEAVTISGIPATITLSEGAVNTGPQLLFPGVVFDDPGVNLYGTRLSFTRIQDVGYFDFLIGVHNEGNGAGQVGVTSGVGTSTISYGGVAIATLFLDGTLYFNAGANPVTPAMVSAVLRNLTITSDFANAQAPDPAHPLHLTMTLNDPNSNQQILAQPLSIALTPTNDAPQAYIAPPGAPAAIGAEFLVNTATAGNQTVTSVTALKGGGYVIAWGDASAGVGGATGDSSGFAVKTQMFAADGTKIGGEVLVNTATAGNQIGQVVGALSNGGYVVS